MDKTSTRTVFLQLTNLHNIKNSLRIFFCEIMIMLIKIIFNIKKNIIKKSRYNLFVSGWLDCSFGTHSLRCRLRHSARAQNRAHRVTLLPLLRHTGHSPIYFAGLRLRSTALHNYLKEHRHPLMQYQNNNFIFGRVRQMRVGH